MKKLSVVIALFALSFASCAHLSSAFSSVTACLSDNADLHSIEQDVGKSIIHILQCDSDFSADKLPACAESGLTGLVMSLGPDGARFVLCVIGKISGDEAASQFARKRAKAFMIKNSTRAIF